jgi:hypothetical protein
MSAPEFINANIAKNLEKEILNILGDDIKKADTSLFERKSLDFRDIVNNTFPTVLIVDYVSIRQELSQYQDIEQALKTYIAKEYTPTAKDYNVNKLSTKEIAMLVQAIKYGISSFSKSVKQIDYRILQLELSKILKNSDNNSSTTISQVQKLFSQTYKLSGISGSDIDIFIFPNFANLGNILRRHLSIGLQTAEASANITSSIDSIGEILAYGHTAAGYLDTSGKAVLNFNSPKSLAIMFEVMNSVNDKASATKKAVEAVTNFVTDTRQVEAYINIEKEFSEGFLKMFVSVGGNVVKFENTLINSRRGSVLETKEKLGVNKAVLDKLASAFSKADTLLSKRLSRYILAHKKSPSALEYINYSILSALTGKPSDKYSGKASNSKTTKDNIKKQSISGVGRKVLSSLPKLPKPLTKISKFKYSLTSLQTLINSQLQNVISANMGDGDARNVLNYRTGRFAASAAVERMSASRTGMITAFYTYMKNPYQTFEPGFRQGSPKTRDPKLLVSKSIRDIAATKVGNRLRAVLL